MQYVSDPWLLRPALRELTFHPTVCRVAEALAGAALRLFSSEVLLKAPGRTAPTPAHDDDLAVPVVPSESSLTVWVALVDVPVERGALRFIPGSHRRAVRSGDAWDVFGTWPELTSWPLVTVPLHAGDCTFHHVRTVHAAGANTSDAARISATATCVAADGVYRPQPSGETVEGLAVDEQLPDDDYPIVRRSSSPPVSKPG